MERIHVAVRARPLSSDDVKTSPWRISGNTISFANHSQKFEFDRIFGEDSKTVDVYQARTEEIVAAAVRGFNGTVFAYGQTNSGKTYTMRGSTTEPGVISLSVHDLFDTIHKNMDREFLLRMSYMEIYNEEINDLLAPEHRKLQIHESPERGIYVAGLREEIVASLEQVLDLIEFGESHRHIGETNMNLYSSRSHTIFRMIIESRDRSEDEDLRNSCDAVRVSVLNLVDLAGSERAAKTGAEGVRLKEGSHINKSLMTLGTVIKKLSDGAESQGGHVPYRDSKLTRILQPALGGNANTAMICNITLAQIHADETKSSLQFASRALCVTNCAHVNEILTDAALLKRQTREIEELRAKLQDSHSEHLEEEILNLRNTLLKTELERERIALELEEEKKAQAERERRLQEQAKKIENLSSMVLYSSRDEYHNPYRKVKRRDTWCPGNLLWENNKKVHSPIHLKASAAESRRSDRYIEPLLPFEDLVNGPEDCVDESCNQDEESTHNKNANVLGNCVFPDPSALLHVTNRRRGIRKKSLIVDKKESVDMEEEYENMLLKLETLRTVNEIEIDCLRRNLFEANLSVDGSYIDYSAVLSHKHAIHGDRNMSSREIEAIAVIKQLQEQIKMLEIEKFSSEQNLDSIVELATEQNICAREKNEELYKELQGAHEEAMMAQEHLAFRTSERTMDNDSFESVNKLLFELMEMMLEAQNSRIPFESVCSIVDELFQSYAEVHNIFLEMRSSMHCSIIQVKSIANNYENVANCMRNKITELENEKHFFCNQSDDFQRQIEQLILNAQDSEKAIAELSGLQQSERCEFDSHTKALEKELSSLSSCSLAREKENLRKDLEKTRAKLRESEFKLKNAIQEKTKLEGEKACAEREIKQLHGQKFFLERDISRRDSLANRRRDSAIDMGSKVFDPKRAKAHIVPIEQNVQEEFRKLEVLAFEMEATIASLEEQLHLANGEKEEALSRNESLAAELEAISHKLEASSVELNALQEEVRYLKVRLEESESFHKEMEGSINILAEEKEELAGKLTDALLEMEEEKAIWFAKEKASIGTIEKNAKSHNAEITLLSNEVLEVRSELDSYIEECKFLTERLALCQENTGFGKQCSIEKPIEMDQLQNDLLTTDAESKQSQEILSSKLENYHACEEVGKLKTEQSSLKKEKDMFIQLTEFDTQSNVPHELQSLKNELFGITNERDELRAQVEAKESLVVDMDILNRNYNDRLSESQVHAKELTRKITDMEHKLHSDGAKYNKEKAKLRMRLHWTQAKLDAFRGRCVNSMDELRFMDKKYEEASGKLKGMLASYASENLRLKKELTSLNGL